MARLLQEPKEEHLTYLRELITVKYLKPIVNTHDCKLLEDAILLTINQRISTDTIARLFGIKKSDSSPSIFTLDTCSIYLGYTSWEELTKSYLEQNSLYQKTILFDVIKCTISIEDLIKRLNASSKSTLLYETLNQIILCKVHQKDEIFFKRLFNLQLVFEYQESYKYDIYHTIHLLGTLCEYHDWLSQIAINHYYNLPYSANYFVEWLVVPEKSYYFPLLENCYQSNKSTSFFYHLIHCTYYAEVNQWELFIVHYDKITVSEPKNNMLEMRWLGVQLYYDKHFKNNLNREKLISKILKHSYTNSKDSGDRVSSIFMICNYLIVIEAYDVIITIFEQNTFKNSSVLGYWAELNYNQLKVYYANALYKTGVTTLAKQILSEVKKERFDLNFKERIFNVYHELKTTLHL